MTASRIYKVTIHIDHKTDLLRYIRANSRSQAERYAMSKYVKSCVASQDDIIDACDKGGYGIEDARKEAAVDEGTDKE